MIEKALPENRRAQRCFPASLIALLGRGRWALLTDLCWERTRAVCAAEGLAFIFLIIRFCTLSRKFLLKILYLPPLLQMLGSAGSTQTVSISKAHKSPGLQ